jgi:hypothetical protein
MQTVGMVRHCPDSHMVPIRISAVIVMSSLCGYNTLHEHLLELAQECRWWGYITTELDHHVEEMELLCTLVDLRIHALCSLYCYLRDGKDKSWYSTTIQQQHNMNMASREGPKAGAQFPPISDDARNRSEEKASGMAALCCRKCHTCLHTGGDSECPWKKPNGRECTRSRS